MGSVFGKYMLVNDYFRNTIGLIFLLIYFSSLLADDLTSLKEQIRNDQTIIESPVTIKMVQKQAYIVSVGKYHNIKMIVTFNKN